MKGKSKEQAAAEYVTLVAKHSKSVMATLNSILGGTVKTFNYTSPNANLEQINKSSGGALQKSVSRPKNTNAAEDQRFLDSMDNREKKLKIVYDQLSKSRDGAALVDKVKRGVIKPTERDKLGRCALLMAIDVDCKLEIIKQLIEECGCDPKSADAAGDTSLHYSVNLEKEDVEAYLIEKVGPQFKEVKNHDGETPYD